MQEAYPVIATVPTHILTWGKWIEESFQEPKEVVICITGNPGLPGFYTQFLSTVYECLNKEVPVWVIGHAGHDEAEDGPYKKQCPPVEKVDLYNLQGQLDHKIEFIRKYVPEHVKIHLIGHSIGCYLALELMKIPDINQRIHHCYFLFPTIERMAASRNGFILTRIIRPMYFAIEFFILLFAMLPKVLRVWIIYAYFLLSGIPKHFLGTTLKYTNPRVMKKVWLMALDEMGKVRDLDIATVRENKSKIKLYYGTTDGWVPIKYYNDLRQAIPDVDAELCTRKLEHAFVLRSAEKMGFMVSEWIMLHRAF